MSDIIIYGAGKTGQALKSLLKYDKVAIFDDDLSKTELTCIDFEQLDLVITSPGVAEDSAFLQQCRHHGVAVVGELQFCYWLCKNQIVSITGTNGKTTVTQLLQHMLNACKRESVLLGNGGVPFSSGLPLLKDGAVVVLESSSFQLKDCFDFKPCISVLTNLAPDHLDYHKSYRNYVDAKSNNFSHQTCEQFAVFNLDDTSAVECASLTKAKRLFYSTTTACNCYYDGENIVVDFGKKQCFEYSNNLSQHNLSNVLCAVLCVAVLGCGIATAIKSLTSFTFDNHRCQLVLTKDNVRFVDDSKATNIHAVVSALASISGDVYLILGGVDKGLDFMQLVDSDEFLKVRFVACIGQTADKIAASLTNSSVECVKCDSLLDATRLCYRKAKNKGGTVLLSPACSSFDMFENYQQRGFVFQQSAKDVSNDKT